MHFHHTTETGTTLCGDVLPHPERENHYVALLRVQDERIQDQLVFIFTAKCGYPVLVEEYSALVGQWNNEGTKKPIEALIPKRILTKELPGVRAKAAELLGKALDYVKPELMIEPSESYIKAMHKLEHIKTDPYEVSLLPPSVKSFLMGEVDEMIRTLQSAPNSHLANDLAEEYLRVLPNLETPPVGEESSDVPLPN